jgi:hypothetical protein
LQSALKPRRATSAQKILLPAVQQETRSKGAGAQPSGLAVQNPFLVRPVVQYTTFLPEDSPFLPILLDNESTAEFVVSSTFLVARWPKFIRLGDFC